MDAAMLRERAGVSARFQGTVKTIPSPRERRLSLDKPCRGAGSGADGLTTENARGATLAGGAPSASDVQERQFASFSHAW